MIYNVQYLRFFASAIVVIYHATQKTGSPQLFMTGAFGVDIFFVISGFIMIFITENRKRGALNFFLHRLARVGPPYWIITLALAAALFFQPGSFAVSLFSVPYILSSVIFLPHPNPGSGEIMPLYNPGWTLNYEFFFYSLFSVAIAISHRHRALLASSFLAIIVIAGAAFPHDGYVLDFYTNPILIEFIYGMLIGYLVVSGNRIGLVSSIILIALGIVGIIATDIRGPVLRLSNEQFFVWGLPAAAIVAGSIFFELSQKRYPSKFLLMLGNASYAIYITHYTVLTGVIKAWTSIGFPIGTVILIVSSVSAVCAGVLFHFLIEKPLITVLSGSISKPQQRVVVGGG